VAILILKYILFFPLALSSGSGSGSSMDASSLELALKEKEREQKEWYEAGRKKDAECTWNLHLFL